MFGAVRRYYARNLRDGEDDLDQTRWDGTVASSYSAMASSTSLQDDLVHNSENTCQAPWDWSRASLSALQDDLVKNESKQSWDWNRASVSVELQQLSKPSHDESNGGNHKPSKSRRLFRRRAVSCPRNLVDGADDLDQARWGGPMITSTPAGETGYDPSHGDFRANPSPQALLEPYSGSQLLKRQKGTRDLKTYCDRGQNENQELDKVRYNGTKSNVPPYSDAAKTAATMIVSRTNDKMLKRAHNSNRSVTRSTARTDRTSLSSTRTDRSTAVATFNEDSEQQRSSSVVKIYTKNHRIRAHRRDRRRKEKKPQENSDGQIEDVVAPDSLTRLKISSLATRRTEEVQGAKLHSRVTSASHLRETENGPSSPPSAHPTELDLRKIGKKGGQGKHGPSGSRDYRTAKASFLSKVFGRRLVFFHSRARDDASFIHGDTKKADKRRVLQESRKYGKGGDLAVSSSSMKLLEAADSTNASYNAKRLPSDNHHWNRSSTRSITSHTSNTTALTISPVKQSKRRPALTVSGDGGQSSRLADNERSAQILAKSLDVNRVVAADTAPGDRVVAQPATAAAENEKAHRRKKTSRRTKQKDGLVDADSAAWRREEMRVLHAMARAEHNARVKMLATLAQSDPATSNRDSRARRLTMTGEVVGY